MENQEAQESGISKLLRFACDVCGVVGGVVLIAMAAMTVASVVGRALFDSPILGDVELVQLGLAVCVSTFLPYTQFQHANIVVDFFTTRASRETQRRMDGLGTLFYTIMMSVLAWQVWVGGMTSREHGDISMLMSLPIWISYVAMVPGLILSAIVGLYHTMQLWNLIPRMVPSNHYMEKAA